MTDEMTSHGLTLTRREKIDVISFDEENIVAQTTMGVLIIRGDKLHINSLNLEKGTLNIDGNVTSLMYDDDEGMQKNSFFAKLFK